MNPTRHGLNADRRDDAEARWALPAGTVRGLHRLARPTGKQPPPLDLDD